MSDAIENPGKKERMRASGCWFRASSPRLRTRSRSTASWAFRRVESSDRGLTFFSMTSFSATSNIREARVRDPWFNCSTAATTISWNRFPTSSWSWGRVTTRRMACVAEARAEESASSTGSDGRERGHGGIERPRVRMTSPDGTSTPAARSRSRAEPSSPSDRAAIAATARI